MKMAKRKLMSCRIESCMPSPHFIATGIACFLVTLCKPVAVVKPAPRELWMLYQDCFFETPGLMNVFAEFTSHAQERFGEG